MQGLVDEREIVGDDRLRAVFGRDRVNRMEGVGLVSPRLGAV